MGRCGFVCGMWCEGDVIGVLSLYCGGKYCVYWFVIWFFFEFVFFCDFDVCGFRVGICGSDRYLWNGDVVG